MVKLCEKQSRRPRVRAVSSRFMSPSPLRSCNIMLETPSTSTSTPSMQHHQIYTIKHQKENEGDTSAASKLVQLSGMATIKNVRSSMPDAAHLLLLRKSSPLIHRSLNSSLQYCNTIDSKKLNNNHQEQIHSLRLLHNRCLQWRYVNAKAESAIHAQSVTAQTAFQSLMPKISQLRESVKSKRLQLVNLNKTTTTSTIIQAQMPHLDEWSALEVDYSTSLSGAITALQAASLRLPVNENVRVDIEELQGALNSASSVIETMSSHFQSFLPKAQEMDTLISELAGVVKKERVYLEECGALLDKRNMIQVEECSLRSQLIQLKRSSFI